MAPRGPTPMAPTPMATPMAQAIWEDILDEFSKHDDIDFAYPTQRFYHNHSEGKPGTRPEAIYSKPDGSN